jgi:hypothetical protein
MITLLCPEGAFDYPIAHGTQQFHPYRLDHLDDTGRECGGPWAVDIPDELVQYFLGQGGFAIMNAARISVPAGMIRLRKADGSDASCGYEGIAYPEDDDGSVLVPMGAMGALIESHGYEPVGNSVEESEGEEQVENESGMDAPPRRGRGRPRKVPLFTDEHPEPEAAPE